MSARHADSAAHRPAPTAGTAEPASTAGPANAAEPSSTAGPTSAVELTSVTGPTSTASATGPTSTTGTTGPTSTAEVTAVSRELSGRALAAALRSDTAERAAELSALGTTPHLAVVSATADESSAWYVRSIARSAEKAGLSCSVVDLGPAAGPSAIRARLRELSADRGVHGIILQTPLPAGALLEDLASAIDPVKDVDGANPLSLGRLAAGLPAFAPATAEAVVALLDHHRIALEGRHAVVVGRSTVVGKPAAHLLLDRNATVTVCHSRTRDLAALTRTADVLVAAVGHPRLITPAHVHTGTVIIDVGTNPTEDGSLVGDVDPAVAQRAAALTPVPGGVGPVTTALLLQHTVRAALTVA